MFSKIGKLIAAALVFAGVSLFAVSAFAASGPALFRSQKCIACHTIDGYGGHVGPNLSHIGSQRSFSWIKTQIVTPGAHFALGSIVTLNGKSYMVIMPNYKSMPASDVNTIAKYLESLGR